MPLGHKHLAMKSDYYENRFVLCIILCIAFPVPVTSDVISLIEGRLINWLIIITKFSVVINSNYDFSVRLMTDCHLTSVAACFEA